MRAQNHLVVVVLVLDLVLELALVVGNRMSTRRLLQSPMFMKR